MRNKKRILNKISDVCGGLVVLFVFQAAALNILVLIIIFTNWLSIYPINFSNFIQATETVRSEFSNLIVYFYLPTNLNVSFFSAEDIKHMVDVKRLFQAVNLIALLLFIIIKSKGLKPSIAKIKIGRIYKILTLLMIFFLLFWEKLFILFHQIFFTNGGWQLNPETSNLIKYFMGSDFLIIFIIWQGTFILLLVIFQNICIINPQLSLLN